MQNLSPVAEISKRVAKEAEALARACHRTRSIKIDSPKTNGCPRGRQPGCAISTHVFAKV